MGAAASLGCRFATAYRAVVQVGQVRAGERVLVLGCGGVGLSILMIAHARGAAVIAVDTSAAALELARDLGADTVVQSGDEVEVVGAVLDHTPGGVDASFDALGSIATCRSGVESLRPRGRHVQVGLLPPAEVADRATVPMHRVIGRELVIMGSHGMSARDYPQMVDLLSSGDLDPIRLVTRTLRLDQAPAALETLAVAPYPGITLIDPTI
jgi:alcohol dehydrogenase